MRSPSRLGLTSCRVFTEWKSIEPGPGHYALEHWDRFFDAARATGVADRHHHLRPAGLGACPRPARRLPDVRVRPGRIQGDGDDRFQALQGIVLGLGVAQRDHAGRNARLCVRLRQALPRGGRGGAGSRPELAFGAGGRAVAARVPAGRAQRRRRRSMWTFCRSTTATPRVSRRPARTWTPTDIARPSVWENESCAFVIQWDCPGLDWVSETVKSNWVLTQWTDELAAGCEKLIYFGGEGASIGYGDYLLSDFTPLPVAATLAVFAAKTFDAQAGRRFFDRRPGRRVPSLRTRRQTDPGRREHQGGG